MAVAGAPLICVLHADTLLPDDAMAVIATTMADRRLALASFLPLLSGPDGVRWGTSLHNWAKTYYGPLLFRPHLFLRGARLLFGDHAMFFRRADFLAAGGCDTALPIMEDVDLCIRLHRFGRTRMVNRVVITSDRRIAAWGPGAPTSSTCASASVGRSGCGENSTVTIRTFVEPPLPAGSPPTRRKRSRGAGRRHPPAGNAAGSAPAGWR